MKLGVAIMCKDEGCIIERCLSSIVSIADEVIITDTGSADDTIVKAGLYLQAHNIKFKIYNEQFVDFAYNRNLLLQRAALSDVDYVLMLDADEQLICHDKKLFCNELKELAGYNIRLHSGNVIYYLPRITRNKLWWEYIGVTHEFLETAHRVVGTSTKAYIIQKNDGFRRVQNRKFTEDITLLTKAIAETSSDALKTRYTFYLGQSYFGLEKYKEAIEQYSRRVHMGGWKEEIFYSFYQLGNIYAQTSTSLEQVFRNYLLAFETCPHRLESIAALKSFLIEKSYITEHNPLFQLKLPLPEAGLFIEKDKYEPTIYTPL